MRSGLRLVVAASEARVVEGGTRASSPDISIARYKLRMGGETYLKLHVEDYSNSMTRIGALLGCGRNLVARELAEAAEASASLAPEAPHL